MLSRLCANTRVATSLFRVAAQNVPQRQHVFRNMARSSRRTEALRETKSETLRERLSAPAGDGAFSIGKGAVAGGAALGLGALCFYGMGLSSGTGAIDKHHLWPKYVKDRIKTTYLYFGGSIAVTAASAAAAFRSPIIMNLVARNGWMAVLGTIAAMMATGTLAQSLPYQPGFGAKQLAWMLHAGVVGAVIAPICLLGGPLLTRAAWYTAGVVGGLSTVAVCAPSEKFLYIGGPLAIGLGVVLASSVATMFLPPTTALGAGLYSVSLYGGLLLFSAFLLYDTQRIIKKAETWPLYASQQYDPVNASLELYMDTLNVFIHIVSILLNSESGDNKKR
ncbi:growth hormone-inducible transmembrane protein-like isoform X1 [Ctenocephalides felis]|uniref:growth hormone-inducible transmembrane protein-like isoform X1 n=1 Tax=Ctenocephalides felis TaxID=7515 RepID=UPI000E6E1019|nr:growth hormone-inducible transmembrane protein-like isoform X1 [Ctenocephalides felis]XP_026468683.1 growth hormone-inducible transmembrane protein-like isoform X1 [Ctenocephalides felis]XP_026468684.1 growth hormone-inducible transmembrane protein-like isoform X1 [Ctenocephalides felis]XP_026468685.1 growth hormone-inducible transmembrane protein-like isoform X1 [Ctenocephalides felis]